MISIKKILDDFGREAYLQDDNQWSGEYFRCFIQPLRYKNKMYLDGVNTQIGFNSEGHYLYIGPPDHDLTADFVNFTWLNCGGEKYKIDRAEKVYYGSEVFYIWAVIRKMVEVEE